MVDWAAAVFARNEQATIGRCLEAILDQLRDRDALVVVIVNGSTDGTADEIIKLTRNKMLPVRAYRIPFGDKANAWNVFIHQLRPMASTYFFVDGYAEIREGSLDLLSEALTKTSTVAATAIPTIGRSAAQQAAQMKADGTGLQGSLHALRGDFVDEIVARSIRQPIGTYRVDGLVGAMALHGLAPERGIWDKSKIAIVEKATWSVSEKSLFNISDAYRHFNRLVQQARGRLQNAVIKEIVLSSGYESLPRFIDPAVLKWIEHDPETRRPNDLLGALALRRMMNAVIPADRVLEPRPLV